MEDFGGMPVTTLGARSVYTPISDALGGELLKAILGKEIAEEIGEDNLKHLTSIVDKGRLLGGMHLSTSVEREGIIRAVETAYEI